MRRSERPRCFFRLLGIAAAMACWGLPAPAVGQDVGTVTLAPFPAATISEFDHDEPPTDPPLEGEAADANTSVDIASGLPGTSSSSTYVPATQTASVKLTATSGVNSSASATSMIRLPDNADQDLKDHENGHSELGKYEYDKNAKKKIEDAFRTINGMMFTGSGMGTAAAAQTAARQDATKQLVDEIKKRRTAALKAIEMQTKLLNEKYDRLTDHGKGSSTDPKEKKPLDSKTGVAATKAEFEALGGVGNFKEPDSTQPHGGIQDPAAVFFDADESLLSFGGDMIMDDALSPTDALLGHTRIEIDPLVWIGVAGDGSIHLSDTALRIVDVTSGDVLLDAYLLNVSYRGFDAPGAAGQIVAGLDIPPDFAAGVNNAIGSDFLAGLAAARDAGKLTTFYFLAKNKLVDPDGVVDIPSAGTTGRLVMGTPTPEPSSSSVCSCCALSVLGAGRRPRRRLDPKASGRKPVRVGVPPPVL